MENRITPHFTRLEMVCPCCGECEMDSDFMNMLEKCRKMADIGFRITSGYRCTCHNGDIGGHKSSAHTRGKAADIRYRRASDARKIVDAACAVGFEGIEVGTGHIHLDNALRSHGGKVLWTAVSK